MPANRVVFWKFGEAAGCRRAARLPRTKKASIASPPRRTIVPPARPLDGVSLLPWIDGGEPTRPRPIAFEAGWKRALVGERWKLISTDEGETYALYDLVADPGETTDRSSEEPEVTASMRAELETWRESCRVSREIGD